MPAPLAALLPFLPDHEQAWLNALLVFDYAAPLSVFNPQAFVLQKPFQAVPWPRVPPEKPWSTLVLYLRFSQPLNSQEIAWLKTFQIFFNTLHLVVILYPGEKTSFFERFKLKKYLQQKVLQSIGMPCQVYFDQPTEIQNKKLRNSAWQQQQQRALTYLCQKYQPQENFEKSQADLEDLLAAMEKALAQLLQRLSQLNTKNQDYQVVLLAWQQDLTYLALLDKLKNFDISVDFSLVMALANKHLQWKKQLHWRLERYKKGRSSLKTPWAFFQGLLKQGERLFHALLFSTFIGIVAWIFGINHGLLLTFILLSSVILGWRFYFKKTTSYVLIGKEAFHDALKSIWQSAKSFQYLQKLATWERACRPTFITPTVKP